MTEKQRTYIAIDLKSFYASVECVQRGLNPLTACLVVADITRTEKTICLAVSPALKSIGLPGRPRLFEVVQRVNTVNNGRKIALHNREFAGGSVEMPQLLKHPELKLEYIVAPPQMAKYMQVSTQVFNIYMKYAAPEDIHVYSVDEIFMDATDYLETYGLTARELTVKMIHDVLNETGITATAGIGSNLYLCKIAMDIEAKHMEADENGVRIAELTEKAYREKLWEHAPLSDFWRVGRATQNKLNALGLYTMGDVARFSLKNYEKLYRVFGIQAELLIDHAWGYEPTRMCDIKNYKTENNSLSVGQVLSTPYPFDKGLLIVREMTDALILDLVARRLVTDQIILTVCYDTQNITEDFQGEINRDYYGRPAPKKAHGCAHLPKFTSSEAIIALAMQELYKKIVNPAYTVRRINVVVNHVIYEKDKPLADTFEQLSLFEDITQKENREKAEAQREQKERARQEAVLAIKQRYGKNAILKGMNFVEGATARERNKMIGGHKSE